MSVCLFASKISSLVSIELSSFYPVVLSGFVSEKKSRNVEFNALEKRSLFEEVGKINLCISTTISLGGRARGTMAEIKARHKRVS